jgi:hypothetical protein
MDDIKSLLIQGPIQIAIKKEDPLHKNYTNYLVIEAKWIISLFTRTSVVKVPLDSKKSFPNAYNST